MSAVVGREWRLRPRDVGRDPGEGGEVELLRERARGTMGTGGAVSELYHTGVPVASADARDSLLWYHVSFSPLLR